MDDNGTFITCTSSLFVVGPAYDLTAFIMGELGIVLSLECVNLNRHLLLILHQSHL